MAKTKKDKTLFIITLALAIFVLGLFIYKIVALRKVCDSLVGTLTQTEQQRDKLRGDLRQIQKEFDEQKAVLANVTQERDQFQKETENLKSKVTEVEDLLNKAKVENEQLNKEIAGLKEDLRLWNGDIKSLKEIKDVVARRKQSIRNLRQKVYGIQVQARKDLDELKSSIGNHGFLMKDGKSTLDREKAIQLEKIIVKPSGEK